MIKGIHTHILLDSVPVALIMVLNVPWMQHHWTSSWHIPARGVVVFTYFFLMSACRLWGFLLASACSCWLPPRSSSWPLPSCSAASASAAKATTTRCQPKRAVGAGARRRFKAGPSSFSFSTFYVLFLPPALSALYFLGFEPAAAPNRLGIHRSAWERCGRKATPQRSARSEVRGGQTPLWTTVSVCCVTWVGEVKKSGPHLVVSGRELLWGTYFCQSLQTSARSMLRNAYLVAWTTSGRSHIRDNFYFIALFCRQRLPISHHPTQCSSTDSVRSIRVTPHVFGVHSICTQNVIPLSRSRLR